MNNSSQAAEKTQKEGIVVGSIVTVQLDPKKYGANNKFQGKQGEVALIAEDGDEDGPIGVKFPEWHRALDPDFFDSFSLPSLNFLTPDSVTRFKKDDLRLEKGWRQPKISDEQLCNALFGRNMWHTRFILKTPFIPGYRECMHENCEKKALLRIMVNCWGAVCDHDVCPNHAVYHGCNCDGFPGKK